MMDYSLYLVTDERYGDLFDRVEKALQEGVTLVQYRAKHKSTAAMVAEALKLQQLCSRYKISLLINDRLDVALAAGAAGVHLGQDDMPCALARKLLGTQAVIGVTVHDVLQARRAEEEGADYLGAGAVFPTGTKTDVEVLGLDGLKKICSSVQIPVVAIGGITLANREQTLAAGARGNAMVTGLLGVWSK